MVLAFPPTLPPTGWVHEEWVGWGLSFCLGSGECKGHEAFSKSFLEDREEGNSGFSGAHKPRGSGRTSVEDELQQFL